MTSASNRALGIAVLWAALIGASRSATPLPDSAVASFTDGPPFSLVRGTRLYSAARGASVLPGDIIHTPSASLLILELRSAGQVVAVTAIGPSSDVYWLEEADHPTLAVMHGWIKVDTLAAAQSCRVELQGLRLGATSDAGVFVAHVGAETDDVFHEQGTLSIAVRHPEGDDPAIPSTLNQLARRTDFGPLQSRIGVDNQFNAELPVPFRDPLPGGIGTNLRTTDPLLVREVTYNDVADWLSAPRDWRRGFVRRFRQRLTDPAFFQSMDATMSTHPEWQPILHPPPVHKP
jgi:hypothetical protein